MILLVAAPIVAGMDIQFLGANGTVTGSKYLVTAGGLRLLVDCGLFQGYKALRLQNRAELPFDPQTLDAVILTHAHLDHSGYLPLLVKQGFQGKVWCTPATRDLCKLLLPDSGHLLEEEANYANRHGTTKHEQALPLYTEAEAQAALHQLCIAPFDKPVHLDEHTQFTFGYAGHILGAAMVRIEHKDKSLQFSGDLGRMHDPVLRAPADPPACDYLVVESTYGDRCHDKQDPTILLGNAIRETAARGGVVVIPAFAVGRAQELLYYLYRLKESGAIPHALPVYLNSPMAANATHLYQTHAHDHKLSRAEYVAMCKQVHVVNSVEESIALNQNHAPKVIIAASGMATGGRVLHHLAAFAPDSRNTIIFAGFQAGGTRGAAMVAGATAIKIFGEYVPLRARVLQLDNLSAHADRDEIMAWLGRFPAPPQRVFVTHGEEAAADALRLRIQETLHWSASVPLYRDRVSLDQTGISHAQEKPNAHRRLQRAAL